MTWDDAPSGPSLVPGVSSLDEPEPAGHDETIELVGTYLRLTGLISLGRFLRLTDFINASSGYIRVRQANLRQPNGDPTSLVLPELMVDQDEIGFIAQSTAPRPE